MILTMFRSALVLFLSASAVALKTGPSSSYRRDEDTIPVARRVVGLDELKLEEHVEYFVTPMNETFTVVVPAIPASKEPKGDKDKKDKDPKSPKKDPKEAIRNHKDPPKSPKGEKDKDKKDNEPKSPKKGEESIRYHKEPKSPKGDKDKKDKEPKSPKSPKKGEEESVGGYATGEPVKYSRYPKVLKVY